MACLCRNNFGGHLHQRLRHTTSPFPIKGIISQRNNAQEESMLYSTGGSDLWLACVATISAAISTKDFDILLLLSLLRALFHKETMLKRRVCYIRLVEVIYGLLV